MPIERITLVRYRTSDGQDHDEELTALLHERRLEVEPSLAAFIASQADAEQPRLPTTIRRYVLAWEEWRVRQEVGEPEGAQ